MSKLGSINSARSAFALLQRQPASVVAERMGVTVLELISGLRAAKLIDEVYPQELAFIHDNLGRMPASEIQRRLRMTNSQFSQILQKTLGKKSLKGLEEITLEEAVQKTRWLVEEKLGMKVNDDLPRSLRASHFNQNGLYHCIRYAEANKSEHGYYQHFSSVAFLACHAYPQHFRPFQFVHAKTNAFFAGPRGRANYLHALSWVIEAKLGISLNQLALVAQNKYFLRRPDLQFFGLGEHQFKPLFGSKKQMIDALVELHNVELVQKHKTSRELRDILKKAGLDSARCGVEGCISTQSIGVDIHHIFPRARRREADFDVDDADNLIPLCPNHHRLAKHFDTDELPTVEKKHLRSQLLAYMAAVEDR
jgi:hypothetical protein